MNMFSKVFGTRSQREVKRIMPLVEKIESLRPDMQKLSDEELRGKTREFKKRLEEGETLDDLLPEAFAVVREAGKRVLGMEHFRVQLIGGIILHQGRIAEMRTGEGKTLVATLPSYLNALEGKGVHVVTVNDYLAKRDAEEMGKIHEFLGLTVGVVLNDMKQSVVLHTTVMLPMLRTMNSVSIICVTTWSSIKNSWYREICTTVSSMRSTPFLSTRHVPL